MINLWRFAQPEATMENVRSNLYVSPRRTACSNGRKIPLDRRKKLDPGASDIPTFSELSTSCNVISFEHSRHRKGKKSSRKKRRRREYVEPRYDVNVHLRCRFERSSRKGPQTLWRSVDQSWLTQPHFLQIYVARYVKRGSIVNRRHFFSEIQNSSSRYCVQNRRNNLADRKLSSKMVVEKMEDRNIGADR